MMPDGKHAIVTGDGTGVGAEIAETLAPAGTRVTVMGRREAPLRAVARQHKSIGWIPCDVTRAEAVAAAFGESQRLNGPVDVVVANAGAVESVPFSKMAPERLTANLAVNLAGVVNVWQAALSGMKASGWGRLIAVASTAGLKGYPYVTAYCAAKHGVVGLTRALALELGDSGVTANAICPGFIETPLLHRSIDTIMRKTGMIKEATRASLTKANPQNRLIRTDEVAGTALWLCSDQARSVNSQALSLSDGEI
ncbi:MAG: SDR family NAD(P)-dependent oxidoreductase [Arenicellales bacterium]